MIKQLLAAIVLVAPAAYSQTILFEDGTQRELTANENVFVSGSDKLFKLVPVRPLGNGNVATPAPTPPVVEEDPNEFPVGSPEWCANAEANLIPGFGFDDVYFQRECSE